MAGKQIREKVACALFQTMRPGKSINKRLGLRMWGPNADELLRILKAEGLRVCTLERKTKARKR